MSKENSGPLKAEPLMTSSRPYLIRALYEWILDNGMSPMLVADATYPGARLPLHFIRDSKVIVNVSPENCHGFHLDNDRIVFTGNFSGCIMQVSLPPAAVTALYAKETERGMLFSAADEENTKPATRTVRGRAPALKLIK